MCRPCSDKKKTQPEENLSDLISLANLRARSIMNLFRNKMRVMIKTVGLARFEAARIIKICLK